MKFAKNNMVGFATRFGDQWEGVRCGAKTRSGSACQRPAYKVNGKCHLHGGASTGPRTEAGLARLTESRTKHGKFTKEKRENLVLWQGKAPWVSLCASGDAREMSAHSVRSE